MKNALRIVLVEDNGSDAGVTEDVLRRADSTYEVVHAERLSDAMLRLREVDADVVLLDLNLTDSQGMDTVIALRSFAPDVPIIVLTSENDMDFMREAARLGAQDYLIKSRLVPQLIEKAIQYAIERKSVERDLQQQKDFYERLLDEAGVWVEAVDRDGNVILWNKGAERISGYERGEVLGGRRKWDLLYPDEDYRNSMLERHQAMIEQEVPLRGLESSVVTSDGRTRTISWTSNLIRDVVGDITGTMLVGNDVTEEKESHTELQRNEDKYRVLSELTSDYAYSASISKTGTMCMMWAAGAFRQITSYRHEDVLGRDNAWLGIVHPDDRHMFSELPERCANDEAAIFEYRIRKNDGSIVWIEDHIQPITNPDNGPGYTVHGAVKDITDRKLAEQALRESESRFRRLIEGIEESFLMENLDGSRVMYVNPGFERIWGRSSGMLHRNVTAWFEYVHEDDRARVEAAYKQGRADGSYAEEFRVLRSDGLQRWVRDRRQLLRNEKGEVFGVAGIAEDITRRKEAEDSLHEREELFGSFIRSSHDGITLTDEEGSVREWNAGQVELTGISREDALGRKVWDLQFELLPDEQKELMSRDAIRGLAESFVETGQAEWMGKAAERWIQRSDGTRRCLEIVVFPVRTAKGYMIGSISRDVTVAEQDRRALEESNALLRTLVDAIPDQVFIKDREGRFVLVNDAVLRFTGMAEADLLGNTDALFQSPEAADTSRQSDEQSMNHGAPLYTDDTYMSADGVSVVFETVRVPLRDVRGQVSGLVAVSRDISERTQADSERAERERQISVLFGAIPDALYDIGRDGIIRHYRKPMLGEALHDDVRTYGRSVEELFPTEVARLLLHHTRVTLDTCLTQRFEFQLFLRHLQETRHYEARLTASTEDNVLVIVRDITDARSTAELLEAQNEELRSRNEELDTFTHMVAHDLKNPLSLMLGYAELVRSDEEQITSKDLDDYMNSIIFSGRKMTAIIQELLLLASVRKEEIQIVPVDMERTVQDALKRLDELIRRRQADIILPESWETALGYSPWIEEVWVNYIGNAIKHSAPGRRIELGWKRSDDTVRYWVRDDGPGIAEDEVGRLFLPFTRLTQVKIEGHGLGLSIVRRIVEKLGGTVGVDSTEGEGSSFIFALPAAD